MKCNACTRHLLTLIRIKKLGKLPAYEVACNSPMRFHKENITIFIIPIKTVCTPFSPTSNKNGWFSKTRLQRIWQITFTFYQLVTYIRYEISWVRNLHNSLYNQSSAKVNELRKFNFSKSWKDIWLFFFGREIHRNFSTGQCTHWYPTLQAEEKCYKTGERRLMIFLSFFLKKQVLPPVMISRLLASCLAWNLVSVLSSIGK